MTLIADIGNPLCLAYPVRDHRICAFFLFTPRSSVLLFVNLFVHVLPAFHLQASFFSLLTYQQLLTLLRDRKCAT